MYMNEIIKFTLIFISILAVTYDILCGRSGLDQQVVGNKSNVYGELTDFSCILI